jgi:hypothetical protein
LELWEGRLGATHCGEVIAIFWHSLVFAMAENVNSGKRPLYHDLDAPIGTDIVMQNSTISQSDSAPSSSSKSKKKKKSAHERDCGYPPKEYATFVKEVALNYYRVRTLDMLNREYLEKGPTGIMCLQADVEHEIWQALESSQKYNDC